MGDASSPLAAADLTTPLPDIALITHRTVLINLKLLGLNWAPTLQAGTDVVAALGGLVTKQRMTCQDTLDRCVEEQTKTPNQQHGASVLHLLCMCQAPDLASLSDVCHALVSARLTMWMALDNSAEQLGCGSLRILLSPDLASKIDRLLWCSNHSDLWVWVQILAPLATLTLTLCRSTDATSLTSATC